MGIPRILFRRRLAARLILAVGITLLVSISTWAYFNIQYQKEKMMEGIVISSDRLVNTIRLGTRYAMKLNSRDEINQIIRNIGRQPDIENIRIYNKLGEIKFSNAAEEVERRTNIKNEACYICHRSDPPTLALKLNQRIRIVTDESGTRRLGIISPIYNEPSCATGPCHVHPADKKVLGALDLVVSLSGWDHEILSMERSLIGLAVFLFLVTSTIIFLLVLRFVSRPIKALIQNTNAIANGAYDTRVEIQDQDDELGQLSVAIGRMVGRIRRHRMELEEKRDEYQRLFNMVPCLITVNDADYRLITYNREFARTFDPSPGDFCYSAYKGRTERCRSCPVELTFRDGQPHESEEHGLNKDGSPAHWLVKTSPVKDADGNVIAAYEVSLDITERKKLEEKLRQSERKYYAIFNSIPNPVFVLDPTSLEILDCNENVRLIYGYRRDELMGNSFMALFGDQSGEGDADVLRTSSLMNHVRHFNREGLPLYIRIRVAATEFSGRQVMLVTTSDVTKQLEAEQQLIQASKMATLGEMATGVAHELNQPLAVIKSASNFFEKKTRNREPISEEIMLTMSREVDRHVDRASKIINHMREFGRKSDLNLVPLHLGEVMEKAFEMFSQQLKARGIEVAWQLAKDLPPIMADPDRLEQVFINLLINARDAIEEKVGLIGEKAEKRIVLRTAGIDREVLAEVCDSGTGIAEKMKDKLFEPFFTTKPVGKGTGLGLSISYSIVGDCGGAIEAGPGEGGGACFRMRFPAVSET